MLPNQIDFFICGSERGGTTMTGTVLDQLPDVCAVQGTTVMTRLSNLYSLVKRVVEQGGQIEGIDPIHCGSFMDFVTETAVTPFTHKPLFHVCFYENLVNSSRSDVTKDVFAHKAYLENFDYNRYMECFENGNRSWADSLAALFAEFAAASGSTGRVFGEQTPDNALHVEVIRAMYPASKIIFVVRHPITCVTSLMDRYKDVTQAIRQYRNPYAHFPFKNKDVMDNSLFIKFEDIVMNRDRAVKVLGEFLGVDTSSVDGSANRHTSRIFAKYVGDSVSTDRYYRSVTRYSEATRRAIYEKNRDVADTFYSAGETEAIIGYKAAA
ncbi:MAG: sulfotransferase [Pseudomonadota bacterium]|nr:sulfotransferase [Pseudomonadota bacterium]